ncbi:MAG TPA: DUF1569 domain-containing protein [Chitinophagaceae bacterium]|jgi:hypothetical protein|nr:DUF1569 domain-containing protein [Chitinophagaceae bacterium]
MELKNLFEPAVKEEIITRINSLRPATQRKWGKMDVAQMLAHLQAPLGVPLGKHQLKGNTFFRLFAPLIKKQLYNDKPFRRNLPTDKTFKIADQRDFEKEKQQLIALINCFAEETITNDVHPLFGKMTLQQWSNSNWKHLDHHLQQFGV